jgi:hypothetical protein
MKVVKRAGVLENLDIGKIRIVIDFACKGSEGGSL